LWLPDEEITGKFTGTSKVKFDDACLASRNDNDTTPAILRSLKKGSTMPSAHPSAKRDTLNLRIKPEVRGLIDRAAKARGKNRSDFILDAARAAAEEALLDQALLVVNSDAYAEFVARLDRAPAPNPRLQKTLQTPAPWECE
jgi:uncharacterized protein (DUF1778 family)